MTTTGWGRSFGQRKRSGSPPVTNRRTNFTVSQISPLRTCWHCSLTARASRQLLGEGDDQASAHGGDRIWNVALGPQRRRRGVDNRRERQVLRTAWRDEVLRGESSPARRPRSRKLRCTSWRGGGSRAIRGLRNVRARCRTGQACTARIRCATAAACSAAAG